MKTRLLILFTLILLAIFTISCGDQGVFTTENDCDLDVLKKNYRIVEIDECEYIIYDFDAGYSAYGFMAHKGNCKNPIHIYNDIIK